MKSSLKSTLFVKVSGSSRKGMKPSTSSDEDEDEESDYQDENQESNGNSRHVYTDGGIIKGPWTEEEDEELLKQVGIYGPRKWSEIARTIPGKNGFESNENYLH